MPFTVANHVRVSCVFSRSGGNDPVMNTLWFREDPATSYADVRAALVLMLDQFWVDAPLGAGALPIKSRLSSVITGLTYRFHHNDLPGFPDEQIVSPRFTPATETSRLPPQLAVCSSYRAAPPRTPSRRGRFYVGPLNLTAMNNADGTVATQFRTDLAASTDRLHTDANASSFVQWVVASPTNNVSADVFEGFVDGEFDSQERRANPAHAEIRSTWLG